MTLKLQGSSSGHTSLEAPASAGSNTIILPANNGSAGQYLRNTGTAGTLEFGTIPTDNNDYVKIQTVSSASTVNNITVDNLDTSVYRAFQIIGGIIPGGDNVNLNFYWRVGGSDCVANKYDYGQIYSYPTDNTYSNSHNDEGRMEIMENGGNSTREGHRFNIWMFPYRSGDPAQLGNFCTWDGMRIDNSTNFRRVSGAGLYDVDNIYPDGFKLQMSSGQINDLNYSLYGVKR